MVERGGKGNGKVFVKTDALGRGVHDTGIPMGPMGIPWEWEA